MSDIFTFTDAVMIACSAHYGQIDKGGHDYLKHPLHLAHKCNSKRLSNDTQKVAVLHDVLEDSEYTFESLVARGVPENIITSLKLLTHIPDKAFIQKVVNIRVSNGWSESQATSYAKEQEYYRYVYAMIDNEMAAAVKLEDLTHNSDITRVPPELFQNGGRLSNRLKKYAFARKILISRHWDEREELDGD